MLKLALFVSNSSYYSCCDHDLDGWSLFSPAGGVVENMILSRAGLVRYAALPGLDLVRGELCSVLNGVANKTRRLLSSHQQQLAGNLDQYVKDQTVGEPQT